MIVAHERLVTEIVVAMQAQAAEAGVTKCEVDVSGGIDSALVAALACKAFGSSNVVGVHTAIESNPEALLRARVVAEKFGFKMIELDLTQAFRGIVEQVTTQARQAGLDASPTEDKRLRGSLKSCLRAPVGRFVNRCWGGVRMGTGNRDEDNLLRFYQKGGDGEVDNNWIACLFKGEVWDLARYLGVPQQVIDAIPSPDLWGVGDDHADEKELHEVTGVEFTYTRPNGKMGTIEWVDRENDKHGVVNGAMAHLGDKPLAALFGYTAEQIALVNAAKRMERATKHKAQTPPLIDRARLVSAKIVE